MSVSSTEEIVNGGYNLMTKEEKQKWELNKSLTIRELKKQSFRIREVMDILNDPSFENPTFEKNNRFTSTNNYDGTLFEVYRASCDVDWKVFKADDKNQFEVPDNYYDNNIIVETRPVMESYDEEVEVEVFNSKSKKMEKIIRTLTMYRPSGKKIEGFTERIHIIKKDIYKQEKEKGVSTRAIVFEKAKFSIHKLVSKELWDKYETYKDFLSDKKVIEAQIAGNKTACEDLRMERDEATDPALKASLRRKIKSYEQRNFKLKVKLDNLDSDKNEEEMIEIIKVMEALKNYSKKKKMITYFCDKYGYLIPTKASITVEGKLDLAKMAVDAGTQSVKVAEVRVDANEVLEKAEHPDRMEAKIKKYGMEAVFDADDGVVGVGRAK